MKRESELALAHEKDLATLTEICVRAFHADIEVGAPEVGGPPEYDDIAHHGRMLE